MYINYIIISPYPFLCSLPLSRILLPYPFLCSLPFSRILPFFSFPNIIVIPYSVFPPSLPNIICPFNWNTIVLALFCFLSLSSEIVYKNTTSVSIFHFLKYFLKYSVFSLPFFIVIHYSVFLPSLPNISTL